MRSKFSILFVFAFLCQSLLAQVEYDIGDVRGVLPDSWSEITLDKNTLDELASVPQKKDDSFQFAIPVPVEFNPSNSGYIVNENDETVWVLGIRSSGALSLNLILEPFNLPAGAYVYIYNSSKTTIRGAFTRDNGFNDNLLPTMPVPGEEVILECHFPEGSAPDGSIGVSQVGHDYLGIMGNSRSKDGRFNLSQACNIDVNCSEGIASSDIKRSVCRMIVNGTELCSGVLLNNTNQENIPYLITAQHCIGTKTDASRTIFVFGYESPWCNGPDGRVSHSLSGASLMATNEDIDFTLVKLSSFPPLIYKPYLAGWDVSGNVPLKTISIHHPQGDVKKISIDNNPPVSSSFGTFTPNGFWKILQWDAGTTEPGSSGAPLFDQNKRIVGILTGGDAICGRSVNDYFAKLGVSYNLSTSPVEHLKSWIDPSHSAVNVLNGRDPYAPNYLTNDTLSNILAGETLLSAAYPLPGSGYLTGFNSDSIKGYAEYFQNIKSKEITEVWLNIAKTNFVTTADSIRVYVLADGLKPGLVLASKKMFLKEAKDSYVMKINFDRTIPVNGNFYIGWKIWYGAKARADTRQFAIFHSPGRVSSFTNSAWFYSKGTWVPFVQHPVLPVSISLDVKVILTGNSVIDDVLAVSEPVNEFSIYPNPASDYIIINSESDYQHLEGDIFDLTGKKVLTVDLSNLFPGEFRINISGLNQGLYNLILHDGFKYESVKILKIN